MSVVISLANGKGFAVVDDEDAELITKSKWSLAAVGYALGYRGGKNIYMHRLILSAEKGQEVDHINKDKLDNRRSNLRFATRTQNNANTGLRRNSGNKFKGITLLPRGRFRWMAQIQCSGQREVIGYFSSDIEAAVAYDIRAKELFGEFARTNF